ncbi:MAG TPA: SGNH/GDSL hydrolase family protein [Streptosporangiaceae bacterium]|nr:SGNH/GDSL hydrolase family protein [Streptosporangiaceae bacterium]
MPALVRRHPRLIAAASTLAATGLCLLAAAPPASAQTTARYVALGDSYSSGVGAGSYISSSGSCDRSTKAYSQLWANANDPASYVSVACSGATTSSVISSQLSALSSSTTLVSITVGGNDVGFASTMETCVLDSTSTCLSAISTDETKIANDLPGELNNVLSGIRSRAPSARVVVLDYPELYDLSKSSSCIGLSTSDRTALNGAADQLDSAIQAAAGRYSDPFVDVRPYFAGHEICDSSSWLHSVNWLDLDESYHPTAAGQAYAYYPAFSYGAG